jgi:hypothetical protein
MLTGLGGDSSVQDRSDLISTLAASAYIPIWSGRGWVDVGARGLGGAGLLWPCSR